MIFHVFKLMFDDGLIAPKGCYFKFQIIESCEENGYNNEKGYLVMKVNFFGSTNFLFQSVDY